MRSGSVEVANSSALKMNHKSKKMKGDAFGYGKKINFAHQNQETWQDKWIKPRRGL